MTSKFKDLMAQLNDEEVTVTAPNGSALAKQVTLKDKKKLSDRYNFNQGWYDALLNTDAVLNEATEGEVFRLDPKEKRQIVEIGVYEGASTCFWSDFYLDHPESRLISIDPFTGSFEHHENPENYPELGCIEYTARGNVAKSDNAAKVEIIKGFSWFVFQELVLRNDTDRWIDVLYIDGAHDSASVARDVALFCPMVKPGGLVIFDDYAHPDVQRAVDMTLNAFATAQKAMFTGWQLAVKF